MRISDFAANWQIGLKMAVMLSALVKPASELFQKQIYNSAEVPSNLPRRSVTQLWSERRGVRKDCEKGTGRPFISE